MSKQHQSSIATVAGGVSGLGAATARALSSAGFQVSIFDLNEAEGNSFAQRIGGNFVRTDVADAASVAQAFAGLDPDLPLRVHVNCAGVAAAAKTVSGGAIHDPEIFERTVKINLIGSFLCASHAAKRMIEAEPIGDDAMRGVIVNTASVAAYEGQIGQIAYAASKGGIVSMTLPMARDLAAKGIRVCAIAPGLFKTPMLAGLPDEVQTSLGQQAPYPPRLGEPDEFAKMVLSIVDNPMLNGEVIRLDGAIRMTPR